MEQKKLGVIGGMGSKATAVFFERVVENTEAHKDQDHIDMIILNHATLPDRTSTILEDKPELFLREIQKDIELLEIAGVDNIAIPCNTAHYFYDKMIQMTKINIINMVEETVERLYKKYGENSKIGILATQGTLNSGIYEKACRKYNLELCVPNEDVRERTMRIIYDKIKSDLCVESSEIEEAIKALLVKDKCKCVIIACTELSCIKLSAEIAPYCIDAMNVLVEKSIELSGKKVK